MKHQHYFKNCPNKLDIYRICELYNVQRHPIGHAIKKLLCAGERGSKTEIQDYREAIDSIQRAIEMIEEDEAPLKAVENMRKEYASRIDLIGQNGNDGLHYAETDTFYSTKINNGAF